MWLWLACLFIHNTLISLAKESLYQRNIFYIGSSTHTYTHTHTHPLEKKVSTINTFKMQWAFKSFPSILLCTILLFCSLCSLSFKYWSWLIEMTDQNLWFEKPLTHLLLPLPWGNSGHYAQRLVVLEESAPVRGDRKQRQAGFHGEKHPPSQTSPTFPYATACQPLA